MSELTFSFQGSQIHTFVDTKNITWFLAQDVLSELEMSTSNATKFLERHVSKDFKQQFSLGSAGRPAWYVAEPGIYQLTFQSKSDKALEFQHWVFSEVLPSIRAKGGYISPEATQEQLEGLMDEIESLQKELHYATRGRDALLDVVRQFERRLKTRYTTSDIEKQLITKVMELQDELQGLYCELSKLA